jgi:hypothetical protein
LVSGRPKIHGFYAGRKTVWYLVDHWKIAVKRAARPIFEVAAPLVPIQGIPRSLVGRGLLGRRCCYPGVKNCGLLLRSASSSRHSGKEEEDGIEELIVELGNFGRIVPGIVVDELEYLLPLLPRGPGLEHLRQHEIKCADRPRESHRRSPSSG